MANKLVPLLSLSQAKALVVHLEAQEIGAANEIVESVSIPTASEAGMFEQVGELTRELHDALVSFQNDTRLVDITGHDLPDAQDRLNYVIEMTDNAANKTMDAVDTCLPIADQLISELEGVMPNWQKLMSRDLQLGEFKALCHLLDAMLKESTNSALTLRASLTDILMAQDFQDLTGQMIRRVIELVQEIEGKLVGILTVCHDGELEKQSGENKNNITEAIKAEGPIMHAEERDDVVNGQDDVDDLLSKFRILGEWKMTFEVDDEILQDFLVEAGEILELLSEQLVDLENNPNDTELLNAIFRGFHTVKGGAGFLSLTELVETCHGAENVFDCLRQNNRSVSADLMDTILGALDVINEQFEAVQSGDPAEVAPAEILEKLHKLSKPESEDEETPPAAVKEVIEKPISVADSAIVENDNDSIDEMTQNEFDALLDELHEESGSTVEASAAAPENAEISENEFESLLDELHGVGKHSTPTADTQKLANSDEINDDEFESLLDELHGKGAHKGAPANNKQASSSDEITDDEFESLLDELHGAGKMAQNGIVEKPITEKPQPVQPVAKPASEKVAPVAVPKPTAIKKAEAPQKAVAKKTAVAKTEPTVRVDTAILDEIMNMVGELVLVRNRLVSLETTSEDEEISRAVANLDIVTGDLQGSVMKTRMQPIKKVFGKFPRVVRDLARTLGKDIRLDLVGEETDLDKNLVEALADPLVHLVRNSVDHGIEMPNVRMQNGKDKQGRVLLSASQEGDHILLVIEDDGAGMDAEKLKQIAMNKGILDQDGAERMSDKEAYSLIFAPGFSTKVEISDISGRGVGMDVVKTGITKLNGTISIDSAIGKGTRLEIKVPLTLAILPTLMIVVAEQTFALPLTNVNEIFHLDLGKTNIVDGQLMIVIREQAIPLFYLRDWLAPHAEPVTKGQGVGHVVIVQLGVQQVAFVVDALLGQEEVVIKALDKLLSGTPGMAGATITSDGGIALILDLPSLLKNYA